MSDNDKLQAANLAIQAAIQQREQALNQVIDLRVELTLAQAKIAQHDAERKTEAETPRKAKT